MKVLTLLLAALLLSACAKKAPPKPPGPDEQIVYPKAYPSR